MNSTSFIANEDINNHSTALLKVIEILKTQFPQVGDIEIKSPTGYHDIQSQKRDKLWEKFNKYRLPTYTVSDFASLCEGYRMEQFQAHKLKVRAKERSLEDGGILQIEDTVSPAELKYIITEGMTTFGVDPVTRIKNDYPLRYVHHIRWKDFDTVLVKSPLSKVINLYSTVLNILEEAESRGLDHSQLGTLLTKFIEIYYPHLLNTVSTTKDIKIIFSTLLAGLDSSHDINKVQQAMGNFSRGKKMGISEAGLILANLQTELYQLQNPKEKADKSRARAEKQVAKLITNFVEDSCKNEYNKFKQYKNLRNEELSFRQTLDYLSQLETDPTHRLKTEKHFPKNMISITAHNNLVQAHGNQIGKEERRGGRSRSNDSGRIGSRSQSRNSSWNRSRDASTEKSETEPNTEEEKEPLTKSKPTTDKKRKRKDKSKERKKEEVLCGICIDFCGGNGGSRNCKKYPGAVFCKSKCSVCGAFHLEATCKNYSKN